MSRGQWHLLPSANAGGARRRGRMQRVLQDPQAGTEPAVEDSGDRETVLVLHVGSVFEMQVAVVRDARGDRQHFDGSHDGLVNMGKFMFTYEFLQGFLEQLSGAATTFHGYLRCALRGYVMALEGDSNMRHLHQRVCAHLLQMDNHHRNRRSRKLYQAFVSAVFDYISLQVTPRVAHVLCVVRVADVGAGRAVGAAATRVLCEVWSTCVFCPCRARDVRDGLATSL